MNPNYYIDYAGQKNDENPNSKGVYGIFSKHYKRYLKAVVFSFLVLFAVSGNVSAQTTYIWLGGTTDFQLNTNWNPQRNVLANNDILVFQSITQTVINVPSQTIGQIILQNSGSPATITLQAAAAGNTLTLSAAGNELTVNATCALTISTNMTIALSGASSDAGTITVNSGGLLNFTGVAQTDPGNITVNTGGELRFSGASGSDVLAAPAISGGTLTIAVGVTGCTGAAPVYTNGTLQYAISTALGNVSTGVELPASVTNLVIANTTNLKQVILKSSVTVTGTVTGLNVTLGFLTLNGNTLTVTGVAKGVSGMGKILISAASTITFTGNNAGLIDTLYFAGASLGNLNMSFTGANSSLTIGGLLKVSTALTLTSGIINVLDGSTLSYSGIPANLGTGSSSSYISFLNTVTSNYGFELGDAVTSMAAGTYTLPVGTATTTGNPGVSGYRPMKIVWSTSTTTNYFKVGFVNDTGTSVSPGKAYDVPVSGNNRTGYIASFFTSANAAATNYGLSMSYVNSDFTTVPAIASVNIYNWSGSLWNFNCQSSNTPGTPNFINQTAFTLASGTLVLGATGGTDLSVSASAYYWTGAGGNTVWENPANWTGPCGSYPGLNKNDSAYITNTGITHQPTLSSTVALQVLSISNGNVLTLASTAYMTIYGTGATGIQTTANNMIAANVSSTIEYADGTVTEGPFGPWGGSGGPQIVNSSFTYGNLYLSTGSTTGVYGVKYISAAINIAGNLTLSTDMSMFAPSYGGSATFNINVEGNVVLISGAQIDNLSTTPIVMNTNGTTINTNSVQTSNPIGYISAVTANANISVIASFTDINTLVTNAGYTVTIPASDTLKTYAPLTNNGSIAGPGTLFLAGQLYFPGPGTNNPNLNLYIGSGSPSPTINATTTVTSLNVSPYNTYGFLSINTNDTLTVTNTYNNNGEIYGWGSLLLQMTTTVPGGTSGAGDFDPNGTLNLIVGNGATSNTITATTSAKGPMYLDSLTVNSGATMLVDTSITGSGNIRVNSNALLSIANGITEIYGGNLFCSGIIQNTTTGGTLYLVASGAPTIDGGSAGTHGQINVSTYNIAGTGEDGTVSTSGTAVTLVSGSNFVTGGSWTGQAITLELFPFGSVTTVGTAVTWAGGAGTEFVSGGPWNGLTIQINGSSYTIASVTDATHLILTTSAGNNASPVPYDLFYYATYIISSVIDATHLVLTTSAGTTGTNSPCNYGVASPITINSTAFLDFSATTLVYSNLQGQNVINNGTIKFKGNSFGATPGSYAFLTAGGFSNPQTLTNTSTGNITVVDSLDLGNWGYGTVVNGGTINCSNVNLYQYCIFNNNNGGIVHVTGIGGIVTYGFASIGQQWNNNAGSWVDDAGPFFETGGTLVCNTATNTVKYDGVGTQIIYPTTYNNLTIAKSAGSNNGTLANGNDTINGLLTFISGNMNAASSNNTVVVTSTGSVSGASQATGWVNGNLQMPIPAGSATTNFAIGDPSIYAPINLMMAGASASSITAYTLPMNSPFDPSPYPSGIEQNHHVLRYWRMTNNGVAFTSYNATFNFNNPGDIIGNSVVDPPQYVVRQYDPSFWAATSVGSQFAASTQAINLTTIGTLSNPFSDFEIGIDSFIPLPVSLLSFSAKAQENEVLLNWTTASEINNNYFTVEKTADGDNFTTVGVVNGAGSSNEVHNYSLIDESPYKGISYYRLKQTDYDGKFTYSQLQAVDFNKTTGGLITFFPNPVTGVLYIALPRDAGQNLSLVIHVFDMKGSEVIAPVSVITNGSNLTSVDLSALSRGIYTIQFVSDGTLQQSKFVKE